MQLFLYSKIPHLCKHFFYSPNYCLSLIKFHWKKHFSSIFPNFFKTMLFMGIKAKFRKGVLWQEQTQIILNEY